MSFQNALELLKRGGWHLLVTSILCIFIGMGNAFFRGGTNDVALLSFSISPKQDVLIRYGGSSNAQKELESQLLSSAKSGSLLRDEIPDLLDRAGISFEPSPLLKGANSYTLMLRGASDSFDHGVLDEVKTALIEAEDAKGGSLNIEILGIYKNVLTAQSIAAIILLGCLPSYMILLINGIKIFIYKNIKHTTNVIEDSPKHLKVNLEEGQEQTSYALRSSYEDKEGSYITYVALLLVILYYFSGFLLINCTVLESVTKVMVVALLILRLCLIKYSKRQVVVEVLITLVLFVSWLQSRDLSLMIVWLFIIAAQNVDVRACALIGTVTLGALVALTVFASALGIIPSYYQVSPNFTLRTSLGFLHPNTLGIFVISAYIAWLVIRAPKFKLLSVLVAIPLLLFIHLYPKSRTCEVLIISAVLLYSLTCMSMSCQGKGRAICLWSIGIIGVMPLVASVLIAYGFDADIAWMRKLNDLLSMRPELAHFFLKQMPLNLMGHNVDLLNVDYKIASSYLVDMGYINLLIRFGLIPFMLIVIVQIFGLFTPCRVGSPTPEALGLSCFAIMGLMETTFMLVAFNYYIVIAGNRLLGKLSMTQNCNGILGSLK